MVYCICIYRESFANSNETFIWLKIKNLKVKKAKKILKDLLTIDQFKRLGSRQNSTKIKEHVFFNEIDWFKLDQGQLVVSPFKEYLVNNYY